MHVRVHVRFIYVCTGAGACVGTRASAAAVLFRSVRGKLHPESCCYWCARACAVACACDILHARVRVRFVYVCAGAGACVGTRASDAAVLFRSVRCKLHQKSCCYWCARARACACARDSLHVCTRLSCVRAYARARYFYFRVCARVCFGTRASVATMLFRWLVSGRASERAGRQAGVIFLLNNVTNIMNCQRNVAPPLPEFTRRDCQRSLIYDATGGRAGGRAGGRSNAAS